MNDPRIHWCNTTNAGKCSVCGDTPSPEKLKKQAAAVEALKRGLENAVPLEEIPVTESEFRSRLDRIEKSVNECKAGASFAPWIMMLVSAMLIAVVLRGCLSP